MTVLEIMNYNNTLKKIIDSDSKVDALIKFKFLGMLKQFEPVVQNFEKIREDKIREYGTADDMGNIGIRPPKEEDFKSEENGETVIDTEGLAKAQKEFEETVEKFEGDLKKVLDADAEIELKKFKYSELIDKGIPADFLLGLYDLIEE